jgi:hypothetical protein
MTYDQIEKVVNPENVGKYVITISFKSRNNIKALFIQMPDFNELKVKNFWRVIPEKSIAEWKKSRNMNLARIFNGQEFTKLSVDKTPAAA